MQTDSKNGDIARVSSFLKAGTVLVPKPEWFEFYRDKMNNWIEYVVTEKDEAENATIGERWMIKHNCC